MGCKYSLIIWLNKDNMTGDVSAGACSWCEGGGGGGGGGGGEGC